MQYLLARSALLSATAIATQLPCAADTQITVDYAFGFRTQAFEKIADVFMEKHPEIEVKYLIPSQSYEEGHEGILRRSMVNQLPDVHFSGYNQYPALVKRGLTINLDTLRGDTPTFVEQGYLPAVIDLVEVDGEIHGLPLLTASPIIVANKTLVEEAGGSCDDLPERWDEYTALAGRINALDDRIWGSSMSPAMDWVFQALVYSTGTPILSKSGTDIAFDNEAGLQALEAVYDFAEVSGAIELSNAGSQGFIVGRVGMFIGAGEFLAPLQAQIGDRFQMCTGVFPAIDPDGSLGTPIGGAAAVVLAKDAEKQAAAYEFVKFATGPEGQAILVQRMGYPPVHQAAYNDPVVKVFFERNPLHTPDVEQIREGVSWAVFPGGNSVKIVRRISETMERLLQHKAQPDEELERLTAEIRELLPK